MRYVQIQESKFFKNTLQFWINIYIDSQLWETFHNPKMKARYNQVVNIDHIQKSA